MPIIRYLIIIIVFIAKAVSKSSSQSSRHSSGTGNRAGASARGGQNAAHARPQSRRPQPRQSQARQSQPRPSQAVQRTAGNPAAAYSYRRKGFSYSSLKPSEDGLEVLMRRNREREKELEKRIQ